MSEAALSASAQYTIPQLQNRKGLLEVNEAAKRIREHSQASRAREEDELRLSALARAYSRTIPSASSERNASPSSEDRQPSSSRSVSPTSSASGRLSPTMSAYWSSVSDTPPREASPEPHATLGLPPLWIPNNSSTQPQQPFHGFTHAALAVAHSRAGRSMPVAPPLAAPAPVSESRPASAQPLSAEELQFRQRWIDMHFSSQRIPVFHRSPPTDVVADQSLPAIDHLSLSDSDDAHSLHSASASSGRGGTPPA